MTFLCGPARLEGIAQHEIGVGWPKPWWLRCNDCGVVAEYGDALNGGGFRQKVGDRHQCGLCRRAPAGQLVLAIEVAA